MLSGSTTVKTTPTTSTTSVSMDQFLQMLFDMQFSTTEKPENTKKANIIVGTVRETTTVAAIPTSFANESTTVPSEESDEIPADIEELGLTPPTFNIHFQLCTA